MPNLVESLDVLGWNSNDFPHLVASFDRSEKGIQTARDDLQGRLDPADSTFDIVAFGSLARYELTNESDLDYLVVAYSLDSSPDSARKGLNLADNLRHVIGDPAQVLREPGATGIFGKMVSAADIVEVIGLESDTNHSHTRRILLLEESVSLFSPEKHKTLIDVMIRRYLEAKPLGGASQVPRFLLNDLARYWRTLTIDYQAKTPTGSAYSLRYLKLILSRKFTFASSILPLLVLGLEGHALADQERLAIHLADVYSTPPVIRFLSSGRSLLALAPDLERSLKGCLNVIDEFNGKLGRKAWREQIALDSKEADVKGQRTFAEARQLGRRLQVHLEEIFFHPEMLFLTKRFLVF